MILDAHNLDATKRLASVPTPGVSFGGALYGSGYDLNPDYGNGQDPRRAPWPGGGEPWYLHLTVFAPFIDAGGTSTAVVQLHAVASTTEVLHSGSYITVGTAAAPYRAVSSRQIAGYRAVDLAVGDQLYIPIAPWTDTAGLDQLSAVLDPKTLRYIGAGLIVPNGDSGGDTGFSGGVIEWHLVKQGDISQRPETLAYPSGRIVI